MRHGLRQTTAASLLALALLMGCGGGKEEPAAAEAPNPLYVDPATRDFSENPALLESLDGQLRDQRVGVPRPALPTAPPREG